MSILGINISATKARYYADLLRELIVRDMRIRFKGSVLGMTWSLINPLLHLLIFYFLFNLILSIEMKRYSSFAFSGMIAWVWFQTSLSQGAAIIRGNRDLIRQPAFPRDILPVIPVASNLINYCIALPILQIMLVFEGVVPGTSMLYLPAILVVQFLFTLSLTYVLAGMNVVFRDTQYILAVLTQLYFFLTPIFYDISHVPEEYRVFFDFNPMMHIVTAYRDILLNNQAPDWAALGVLSLFSFILIAIGVRIYRRLSNRFVEEL